MNRGPAGGRAAPGPVQGLRANALQFGLLVLVNGFVGAMVGLERTVLPLVAEADFGRVGASVATSFIVGFGAVKALVNLAAGDLLDRLGRKRVLVAGWLLGLPVPLLIIYAPSWGWVIGANVLLGVNQGLCWSATVVMKIDLVGPRRRGLAVGLNEFAGYGALSLAAAATGYIAGISNLRPEPFYLGIAIVGLGLLVSTLFVRETHDHARREAASPTSASSEARPSWMTIFRTVSWRDRTLFGASQAGLATNLKDGMVWGLLPIYLASVGLSVERIGIVAAAYPAVWGIGQLATGALSDRWGRVRMIVAGMGTQALGVLGLVVVGDFALWLVAAVGLGLGTALVYPTLIAAVSDVAAPAWRASALGVYRFWRDVGYAVGALLSGVVADLFGVDWAITVVVGILIASTLVALTSMTETSSIVSPPD